MSVITELATFKADWLAFVARVKAFFGKKG
jgi:hypothetical protein